MRPSSVIPCQPMNLRQRVFPSVPPSDKVIVETKFVGSWESQLRGLGRHTAYLSRDLVEFRADVDDIAMDLVYLQRHRVEVGLKLLLERVGADVPMTHNIDVLFQRVLAALRDAGHGTLANALNASMREFVDLMHAADPGSYAYRYPVDRQNQPALRKDYVDLQELEAAGAKFQESVYEVVASLTRTEHVPVDDDDVEETALDAASTIRALRNVVVFLEGTYGTMEEDREQAATLIGQPGLSPRAAGARAREMADEHVVALRTLEPSLENLLQRLAARRAPDAKPIELDADAIPAPPRMPPEAMLAPYEHAQKRMTEMAEGMARYFPPLKRSLATMIARTVLWPSEADRQLHADLERFHSRILPGVDPSDLTGEGLSPLGTLPGRST
jgi:hypothetical protein